MKVDIQHSKQTNTGNSYLRFKIESLKSPGNQAHKDHLSHR
jgi:hypothetical protein